MGVVTLLLVEDDPIFSEIVAAHLRKEGLEVVCAQDVASGLRRFSEHPIDIVLADVNLPDGLGHDMVRRMKTRRDCAAIYVTQRGESEDRLLGLSQGDDYIVKPADLRELTARVRAVLRRIRPGLADDRITVGDIIIDRVAHRVKRGGKEIHLGPTEFRLLDYLMQHPGRVFSREQLLDAVWGSDVYVEARTVDVHVGRLRKALNVEGTVNPIRTVRSAGYSLDLNN